MHEMTPDTTLYYTHLRITEYSVEPPKEAEVFGYPCLRRRQQPGAIPGRPEYKPVSRYMHNAAYGGFQHVRPLDDMLAEIKEAGMPDPTAALNDKMAREARARELSKKSLVEQMAEEGVICMRKRALAFAEVDVEEDGALDFDNFIKMLPAHVVKRTQRHELEEWFQLVQSGGIASKPRSPRHQKSAESTSETSPRSPRQHKLVVGSGSTPRATRQPVSAEGSVASPRASPVPSPRGSVASSRASPVSSCLAWQQHGSATTRIYAPSGTVTLANYFEWSLGTACPKSGETMLAAGMQSIFRKYDVDASGRLDEMEFTNAVHDMGFGDAAHELFFQLPVLLDGTVDYRSLMQRVRRIAASPGLKRFSAAVEEASQKREIVLDVAHRFEGETPEEVRQSLLALLELNGLTLSDIFREMDDDGSALVAWDEFTRAFQKELHFCGSRVVLEQIFEVLDGDGSGKVGFIELQAWTQGKKTRAAQRLEAMKNVSLASRVVEEEEAWDEKRLRVELRHILQVGGLEATDVVRAWAGGDNNISRKEFLQSMKTLVGDDRLWYSKVRGAATDAFDSIDATNDGSIGVTELCRWLEGGTWARVRSVGLKKTAALYAMQEAGTRQRAERQPKPKVTWARARTHSVGRKTAALNAMQAAVARPAT